MTSHRQAWAQASHLMGPRDNRSWGRLSEGKRLNASFQDWQGSGRAEIRRGLDEEEMGRRMEW